MAAKKVPKVGVKKEKGYLYFVDKAGDVSCAKMARGNKKGGSAKKVAKVGVKKEKGFLYFIDKQRSMTFKRIAPKNLPRIIQVVESLSVLSRSF